jgi:hypothetical protein
MLLLWPNASASLAMAMQKKSYAKSRYVNSRDASNKGRRTLLGFVHQCLNIIRSFYSKVSRIEAKSSSLLIKSSAFHQKSCCR